MQQAVYAASTGILQKNEVTMEAKAVRGRTKDCGSRKRNTARSGVSVQGERDRP